MVLQVIFEDVPNKTYAIEIEGVLYRINIRYNTIDEKWYFSLQDADGVGLLVSQKITINRPMLEQFRRTTFPEGEFVFSLPTASRDPGRNDIEDLILYYMTQAEYESISE